MKTLIRSVMSLGMAALLSAQLALVAEAKTGDTSTWLGALYRGDNGDANQAWLDNPFGFTADGSCNLIIADTNNNVIRRIERSSNLIKTFAGTGSYGLKNGSKANANFANPHDVEIGPDGELYVLDTNNKVVRIIRDGVVSTWLTNLKNPRGSYLDGSIMFISETGNNRIVKATIPNGGYETVATIAAPGKLVRLGDFLYVINADTTLSKVNVNTGAVTAIKTDFEDPLSVAVYHGEIYVVSGIVGTYNEIWKYSPDSNTLVMIQRVLEDNTFNFASDILFCNDQMYLLFKGGSSVYVANVDGSNPVKLAGLDRYGNTNGPKAQVMLGRPKGLLVSKDRTKVYILENHVFKSFNLKTQTLSFIAGFARDGYKDLSGADARMSIPMQIVLSKDGTKIYFVDRNNNRIREVEISTGQLGTVTGAGLANALAGDRNMYAEGADCHELYDMSVSGCAYFDQPTGLAISPDGKTLYVADTENHRIRTVNVATGATKLLAGSGVAGLRDGTGSAARFKRPVSLALSKDGRTLFVLEAGNHALRRVDVRTKRVTKLIGSGKAGFRDGLFRDARLSFPDSVTLGQNASTLYISEGGTQKIRKVDLASGRITTLTGSGSRGFVNGPGAKAKFNNPRGMTLLNSGYLLVADQLNDMVRAIRL